MVVSWFVTLIRIRMQAGSSLAWGSERKGAFASLLTLSFFVLSHQCLKMCGLGVDIDN